MQYLISNSRPNLIEFTYPEIILKNDELTYDL